MGLVVGLHFLSGDFEGVGDAGVGAFPVVAAHIGDVVGSAMGVTVGVGVVELVGDGLAGLVGFGEGHFVKGGVVPGADHGGVALHVLAILLKEVIGGGVEHLGHAVMAGEILFLNLGITSEEFASMAKRKRNREG